MEPSSRRRRALLAAFALAWVSSQLTQALRTEPEPSAPPGSERCTLGPATESLSALRWRAASPALLPHGREAVPEPLPPEGTSPGTGERRLPVVLLHGSPGEASNLSALAERLSLAGREALAVDLPGFGASARAPGGRSIAAHAAALERCIPYGEFHVVGWSMGGGVGLEWVHRAPQRVRSLALVASIGVQEAEGSGSYVFEHVKYAANGLLALGVVELLPHFGLLGSRAERLGYVRNFWESDQRPLRGLLSTLDTPLLLAHGRDDFLVPLWCAEESHGLAPQSRLVIFEAGHFLPLPHPAGQLDLLWPELEGFLSRHDARGVPEPRARVEPLTPEGRARPEPFRLPRLVPWWVSLALCGGLAAALGAWSGFILGSAVALLQLDAGLALIAASVGLCLPALGARRGRPSSNVLLSLWAGWWRGALRLLGAFLAAAAFTGAAGEALCRAAGSGAGVALALALPPAAALALARLFRLARGRSG